MSTGLNIFYTFVYTLSTLQFLNNSCFISQFIEINQYLSIIDFVYTVYSF